VVNSSTGLTYEEEKEPLSALILSRKGEKRRDYLSAEPGLSCCGENTGCLPVREKKICPYFPRRR